MQVSIWDTEVRDVETYAYVDSQYIMPSKTLIRSIIYTGKYCCGQVYGVNNVCLHQIYSLGHMPMKHPLVRLCNFSVHNNHKLKLSFAITVTIGPIMYPLLSTEKYILFHTQLSPEPMLVSVSHLSRRLLICLLSLIYCNLSFSLGEFPEALNIAKIVPVFKCDEHTSFTYSQAHPN